MVKVVDYSNHRGGILALLPKIYAMHKENAASDKSGTLQPPGHFVTWQQGFKKRLTDIDWRFIVATFGGDVAGALFFRFDGGDAYIEELQLSKAFARNEAVFDQIFKKLDFDKRALGATFHAGPHVKLDRGKEMLASVGNKEAPAGGYEKLGGLGEARAALRLRFFAGAV